MTDPLLDGLNPRQLEAVTMPDRNVLVLAGAGSGKTRVLTSRIAWLIREGRARPSGILAVTFTNKAAREMLSRIESLMQVETRGMWVGTFHGICNRLLRIHAAEAGLAPGFQIIDQADQLSVVKRVMKEAGIDKETIEPKQVQAYINRRKEEGVRASDVVSPDPKMPRSTVALQLYRMYEELCNREGIVDFAELMLRSFELLERNELVRRHYVERFSHILVDEFQDTNVLQYRWLKTIAGYGAPVPEASRGCVFAVGDDDQSIYAFRGANVGNMRDFERELQVQKIIRLEQNYRSAGNILDAANALISHNSERLGKNLWTNAGAGELISVMPCESGEAEARFVAEEVESWHMRGSRYSDFAVLYRSNAQSRALETVLMAAGIPYRIYGGHRFFERAHVKDVLAYLRLVENPDDNTAFLRVVNLPARGIGARTVETLQGEASRLGLSLMEASSRAGGQGGAKLKGFAELIVRIQSEMSGLGLVAAVDAVLKLSGLREYYELVDKKEHSAKSEELSEVVSAAGAFLKSAGISEQADALEASGEDDLSPLASFLALATLEAGDNQAGADADAVQLMTVHAAKGLEFPCVFITGLEENLFPHASAMRESGEAGREEERRLMYVAMTRAKKRLCLCYALCRFINGQQQDQQQSSFIDEIPRERLKWLRQPAQLARPERYSGFRQHYGRRSWDEAGEQGRGGYGWGRQDREEGFPEQEAVSWKPSRRDEAYRGSKSEPLLKKRQAEEGWKAGQHVIHPKFGKGVVITVSGSGELTKLQVAFAGAGIKKLVAAMAHLEKA